MIKNGQKIFTVSLAIFLYYVWKDYEANLGYPKIILNQILVLLQIVCISVYRGEEMYYGKDKYIDWYL